VVGRDASHSQDDSHSQLATWVALTELVSADRAVVLLQRRL